MSKKYMAIITHSFDEPYRTCTFMGLAFCLFGKSAVIALLFYV